LIAEEQQVSVTKPVRILGLGACALAGMLLAAALAGGQGLGLPAQAQVTKAPRVSNAWVRMPTAPGRPAAGYFDVVGRPGDALVAVSSPEAGRVEMHSMTMVDGVMRMRAEKSLAIPASGTLALAPGGNHLMLFDFAPQVSAGDDISLVLRFASGEQVTVEAPAKPATTGMPGHQH
jgi:hypothetical protein